MSELGTKYQHSQSELEEFILARQQLETQLQENKIVNEEFEQLEEDTPVYKLTGNVLLPVEQSEARGNVDKRLEFIEAEIKRCEKNIRDKQEELEQVRNELIKLNNAATAVDPKR
ncbi:yke2p [Saccharomyces arboricola H-6]|uniref:Yke2p n=1 Tax=Saccharomyces arboricola (strain H-6 / AS 2.3317 / CBS 10644) TaxID=1160507 RepID=J8PKP5_SACAR|nr:yke2p [Saccharomyces arboricola H-6]